MSDCKLDVEEWHISPATRVIHAFLPGDFSPKARFVGMIGTLLFHVLAYQSVLLGTRAHKVRPPDIQGLGATFVKSEIAPTETLILLDLPRSSISDKPLAENLASLGPVAKAASISLLSPDPLPHVNIPSDNLEDDATAVATIDSGDPNSRAVLFARYTGQIDARIERAWRRPRSPVTPWPADLTRSKTIAPHGAPAEGQFKCQVRILQDKLGNVREVQMLSCNGTAAWKQSLVSAIVAVSPLPAPPSPTVFTGAVTMTFTANSYTSTRAC